MDLLGELRIIDNVFNTLNLYLLLKIFSNLDDADIINCGIASSALLQIISSSVKIRRRLGIKDITLNGRVWSKIKIDLNEVSYARMEIFRQIATSPFELVLYCSDVDGTGSVSHIEELEERIIMTLVYMTSNNLHFDSIEKVNIDLSNAQDISPQTCVAFARFISQLSNVKDLKIKMHSYEYLSDIIAVTSETLTTLHLEEMCFNSFKRLNAPNLKSLTVKTFGRIDKYWEDFIGQHSLLEHLNIEKVKKETDYTEIFNARTLFPNLRTFNCNGRMIIFNR